MRKTTISSRPRKRPRTSSRASAGRKAEIAAALAGLDEIKPKTPKAAKVIGLLKTWLNDDSGYDEQMWAKLKTALNGERHRVGASRLFDE
jgi:hypothetical protein